MKYKDIFIKAQSSIPAMCLVKYAVAPPLKILKMRPLDFLKATDARPEQAHASLILPIPIIRLPVKDNPAIKTVCPGVLIFINALKSYPERPFHIRMTMWLPPAKLEPRCHIIYRKFAAALHNPHRI